jgi:hypothetical protein
MVYTEEQIDYIVDLLPEDLISRIPPSPLKEQKVWEYVKVLAEEWVLQKSKKLLDIYKDMKDKNKKKLVFLPDRIAWEDSPFDFSGKE